MLMAQMQAAARHKGTSHIANGFFLG